MNKIELLTQLTEKEPNNPQMYYILALAFAQQNDFDHALIHLQTALGLADSDFAGLIQQSIHDIHNQQIQYIIPPNIKQTPPVLEIISGGAASDEHVAKSNQPDWNDVKGLDAVKHAFSLRLEHPAQYASVFNQFGYKPGGGFLLYGPPGCGKSMLVRATAQHYQLPLISLSVNAVIDPFYGQSAHNIEALFEEARSYPLSMVLIDDFDTFAYHRAKSSFELRNAIDQLMTELDRCYENQQQVLVVGISDMPWDIDPAMRRFGRMDKLFFVPPPDWESRRDIFTSELTGKPQDEAINYAELAHKTDLFSGADIASVVASCSESIIDRIIYHGEKDRIIQQHDLIQVIEQTHSTAMEWLTNIANYVRFANQNGYYNDVKAYLEKYTDILNSN